MVDEVHFAGWQERGEWRVASPPVECRLSHLDFTQAVYRNERGSITER